MQRSGVRVPLGPPFLILAVLANQSNGLLFVITTLTSVMRRLELTQSRTLGQPVEAVNSASTQRSDLRKISKKQEHKRACLLSGRVGLD